MAKRQATPKPSDASASSEYDAFEKLTKDLLTVSKKDLDEAKAREKTKRD